MKKNILYHDGCKVCSNTGQALVNLLGLGTLDIVHVGLNPNKQEEAEQKGVKTFPALITNNGNVLHLNVMEHEGSVECLFV